MQIKKGMNLAGFILLAVLALTGCTADDANKAEVKSDSADLSVRADSAGQNPSDTVEEAKAAARLSNDVQFIITQKEADDTPTSSIEISSGGTISPVLKISGYADLIAKDDFKSKEIPEDALAACGAWWAGAGDYFYVIESGNKLLVFQGWQDEGQTDEGYHWKKLKEIER